MRIPNKRKLSDGGFRKVKNPLLSFSSLKKIFGKARKYCSVKERKNKLNAHEALWLRQKKINRGMFSKCVTKAMDDWNIINKDKRASVQKIFQDFVNSDFDNSFSNMLCYKLSPFFKNDKETTIFIEKVFRTVDINEKALYN